MNGCINIGVEGLCSDYEHNLNAYGISLNKASKIADSAFVTGKNLVETMIDKAWNDVFSDISIDGFKLKGITKSINSFFLQSTTTQNSFSYTFDVCNYESIKLKKLSIKVIGTLDVNLSINNYNTVGTYTDETIDISNVLLFDESVIITLITNGTGSLLFSDLGYPFEISLEKFCNEKRFFCQYSDWLVEAVKIKASALILNNAIFSDRYNDFILYNSENISLRVGQLDSSLVVLENQKKGLYQLEIQKINKKLDDIIKYNKCKDCCFECANYYETKITMS